MTIQHDQRPTNPIVVAANALTERWARRCSGRTVIAGVGVWPLLAILAASADGDARRELQEAVGIRAEDGFSAAGALLDALRSSTAVRAALGTWFRSTIPVYASWQESVPAGTWGELTDDGSDQERLDAWAQQQTDGLIARMPVDADESLFILASAIVVKTRWLKPFQPGDAYDPFDAPSGPWRGRPNIARLERWSRDLDEIVIANSSDGLLTVVEVRGEGDISFYLAIAEETVPPGTVSAETIRAVGHSMEGRRGSSLQPGDVAPGLTAAMQPSDDSEPTFRLSTVPFRIEASHDLLQNDDVFGLRSSTDTTRGHFPAISSVPLAIGQARQEAVAVFSEEGFEVAAVTAMDAVLGAASWEPEQECLEVTVSFDRPFAFVALHRPSRLVLAAGWVADPQPASGDWDAVQMQDGL